MPNSLITLLEHELKINGHPVSHVSPAARCLANVLQHQFAIRDQAHADLIRAMNGISEALNRLSERP